VTCELGMMMSKGGDHELQFALLDRYHSYSHDTLELTIINKDSRDPIHKTVAGAVASPLESNL